MTREEFKNRLSDLVDSIVLSEGELSDEDEGKLIENIPDVASEILSEDEDEDGEAEVEEKK